MHADGTWANAPARPIRIGRSGSAVKQHAGPRPIRVHLRSSAIRILAYFAACRTVPSRTGTPGQGGGSWQCRSQYMASVHSTNSAHIGCWRTIRPTGAGLHYLSAVPASGAADPRGHRHRGRGGRALAAWLDDVCKWGRTRPPGGPGSHLCGWRKSPVRLTGMTSRRRRPICRQTPGRPPGRSSSMTVAQLIHPAFGRAGNALRRVAASAVARCYPATQHCGARSAQGWGCHDRAGDDAGGDRRGGRRAGGRAVGRRVGPGSPAPDQRPAIYQDPAVP